MKENCLFCKIDENKIYVKFISGKDKLLAGVLHSNSDGFHVVEVSKAFREYFQ